MSQEYLTYVRQMSDLKEDEREMFVKDLTPGPRKYDTRRVRARIAPSADTLPGSSVLWVRSETGVLNPQPWAIKILEELPDFVPGQPWTDVFAAMGQK